MTTLAALITSCRILSGDGQSDNFMRAENLKSTDSGNTIDGTNTSFNVSNFPVVTGKFMAIVADNRLTTALTVNEPIGAFTLTTAPTSSLYASYYYQLFDDVAWTEFINSSFEILAISTGVPAIDVVNAVPGMLGVVKMYASYYFCMRVAKQTGLWYNQRLQERVDDRDAISKKWAAVADTQLKQAIIARDDFYTGSGKRHAPASAIVQHQPRPYAPFR